MAVYICYADEITKNNCSGDCDLCVHSVPEECDLEIPCGECHHRNCEESPED